MQRLQGRQSEMLAIRSARCGTNAGSRRQNFQSVTFQPSPATQVLSRRDHAMSLEKQVSIDYEPDHALDFACRKWSRLLTICYPGLRLASTSNGRSVMPA